MIARALILNPGFVVADEPVSMLDVSVRAGILNLLRGIAQELSLTAVYISHDLSLVRYLCERTIVMYLGKIIEDGPTEDLIREPLHPYSKALVTAVPTANPRQSHAPLPIGSTPPVARRNDIGCAFADRCPNAMKRCQIETPIMKPIGARRSVACHLLE